MNSAPDRPAPTAPAATFRGLDHLAIVVPDTEAALKIWRDQVGLKCLYSEVVNGGVA